MNKNKGKKDYSRLILYAFLAFALVVLLVSIISMWKLIFPDKSISTSGSMAQVSVMKLTDYDRQLAIKFMDANRDGKCDACGMDVELCIQSGQIQCNMDSKSTIGVLGSAHIHSDFKVYANGKAIDFANPKYYMRSSFIHVDHNNNKEDSSGVLHMHASGVPLWIFFESLGMKFDENCLTLNDREEYCNNGQNTLKFYVNDKPNSQWENYVFNDLDKILISYGSETDLTQQLNSITDFASNH